MNIAVPPVPIAPAPWPAPQRPHQGMPAFDNEGSALSFFEFWPMWAFYPPIVLYAAWLMLRHRGVLLPTVANPSFPGGGFFGESKAQILALATRHIQPWVAPFVLVRRPPSPGPESVADEARAAMQQLLGAGLQLPVVAKPDLGCRGAGVKLIRSREQLSSYIAGFPAGAAYLLQRYVAFEGEAGVFYCRKPGQAQGRLLSITLKYFPYVYGDGRSSLRELIMADPRAGRLSHLYLGRHAARLDEVLAPGEALRLAFAGSHSRGAIFRNGTALATPAMTARFDEISKRLPEFYFGRFDIRFEDFAAVQQGEGFTILEINGAGAESTHVWDRRTTLFGAWRDLMRQYRLLFEIGALNRARGYKPMALAEFRRWHQREKALTPLYPPTD